MAEPAAPGAEPGAQADYGVGETDARLLVGTLLVVSACTIVYELLISALSSYFLGSSVLHFSITIGLFLFFMGVGSWLSRWVRDGLLYRYVQVEILIGLFGGASGALLYIAYAVTDLYYLVALLLIAVISILAGLEIPLVTRILQDRGGLRENLADILAFDYLGALLASLLFPLVLLPYLGMQRTAFAMGLINLAVALALLAGLRAKLPGRARLGLLGAGVGALLSVGLVYANSLTGFFEQYLYRDQIVHVAQTPYQRIVLTRSGPDLRLYLNGSLQFSSLDEARYHEPLVHIAAAAAGRLDRVLVLGGGDGLAVRELLRYSDLGAVTLVDLDPDIIALARRHAFLRRLNRQALDDPRVRVEIADAFEFAERDSGLYNLIVIDLPDPDTLDLGKLYSVGFYRLLAKRLAADGVLVTQSSSPYFARKAFWCIHRTLAEVFPQPLPYQSYVPSFGLWGFNLASPAPIRLQRRPWPEGLSYLTPDLLTGLTTFAADTGPVDVAANRLANQILVQYYAESWSGP